MQLQQLFEGMAVAAPRSLDEAGVIDASRSISWRHDRRLGPSGPLRAGNLAGELVYELRERVAPGEQCERECDGADDDGADDDRRDQVTPAVFRR